MTETLHWYAETTGGVRQGDAPVHPGCGAVHLSADLPAGTLPAVRAELPQTVSASVRKGQTFGTLVISCGETEVGRVDLVSARSVQAQETKSETSKNKSLAEKLWQFLSAK